MPATPAAGTGNRADDPWMGARGRLLFCGGTAFLAWATGYAYTACGRHIDSTTAILGGLTAVAILTIVVARLWKLSREPSARSAR